MTNPLYTVTTLPADDQAALREFNDRYIASIGAAQAPAWSDLGDLFPTDAPLVTFPIGSLALKYEKDEGEDRFKTLLSKSFDLRCEEFQAGLEAKLLDLTTKVFAYRNWQQGPARMLIAEGRFRNRAIVTLLEGGHTGTKWGVTATQPNGIDNAYFFSATHLSDFNNPASTTWSNYQVSGKDVLDLTKLQEEIVIMQGALDENGEKIGADPDTILVPTAKYEGLKNLLAKDMILELGASSSFAATNNVFKGRFNVVHVPELTDANDWYLVDSKLRASSGLPPWLMMRYTAPNPELQMRIWDTSSDFFKNTGRIKVSSHIHYGFALGFPHAIRKVTGA
jgi:hypothetical protein